MAKSIFIVEHLNLFSIFHIFLSNRRLSNSAPFEIFFLYIEQSGSLLKPMLERLFHIPVNELAIQFDDIKDSSNITTGYRFYVEDQMRFIERFAESDTFVRFNRAVGHDNFLISFFKKNIATSPTTPEWFERLSQWQSLLIIHKAAAIKSSNGPGITRYLLFDCRWDIDAFIDYATKVNVTLIPISNSRRFWKRIKQNLVISYTLHKIFNTCLYWHCLLSRNIDVLKDKNYTEDSNILVDTIVSKYDIASVWSKNNFNSGALILASSTQRFRETDITDAYNSGIELCSLKRRHSKLSNVPLYIPRYHNLPYQNDIGISSNRTKQFLSFHRKRFILRKEYWSELFLSQAIKLYLTSHINFDRHIAASAAINDLGGISATFQQSFRDKPSPRWLVCTDIDFGFSNMAQETLRACSSNVRYYVTIGYIADFKFQKSKANALEIRKKLIAQGAKTIIAFFDENTVENGQWFRSDESSRQDYRFLLEQVLKNETIGLVFKPKRPSILRNKLGSVSDLLDQAINTGRCYLFKDDYVNCPADAAFVADIAINDNVWAATAGVESAIAGVPTLFLDRDGWTNSDFYSRTMEKVVFNDWASLWNVLVTKIQADKRYEMGDCSPILDRLDPFRDGKAIHRMIQYLEWLQTGLAAGGPKELVLADAAERYSKHWGSDNVITPS
jgi:hypothetical protein